jgi:uncharacterized NAD(P)/FAD-binding protein YdhS
MKRIVIIGGGASGSLLAINLLNNAADRPLSITLVERSERFGRGVAYGTRMDSHLLNVPAAKMGAFPDDIEHFHRWLDERGHRFDGHDFVPRKIFGEYIRSVFDAASNRLPPNVQLRRVDAEVIAASANAAGVEVTLDNGERIVADLAVLAFGNFDPPHPSVTNLSYTSAEKYFRNPWGPRLYESISPDDSMFVVGTGLSMIDVAMHFHKTGHRGKISAISTRGLLPAVHDLGHTYPSFDQELRPMRRITDISKAVRRHIRNAESIGSNWRAVIDSLRPSTQQIWLDLPVAEKRYFKQHLSRYWNVARHRMPAEAAAVLDEMQQKGTLEILKGRLKEITLDDAGRFTIDYSTFGRSHTVTADALINCIGAESNFARIGSPLLESMRMDGLIRNDELEMGLDATPDGHVIGAAGVPSDRIFTLGTALKGILWETTAIPEIRTQARELALKLLSI